MRYVIVSDIHGNLEALQAVVMECQKLQIQTFLCIGDVVGYGASPKECINLLGKIKAKVVAGNHDWAVSGRLDASYFTEDGKAAVEWTRSQISFETIQALSNLPLVYKNQDLILVHATLHSPERFIYMEDYEKAQATFELMDKSICFVGHTHVPQIYVQQNGKIYLLPQQEIEVNLENKYIINVGSVGQPRDENPMASFCIYDTNAQLVEIRRVQYNIKEAQRKIKEAGLPLTLASRLDLGK